jgi:hypothetical protein
VVVRQDDRIRSATPLEGQFELENDTPALDVGASTRRIREGGPQDVGFLAPDAKLLEGGRQSEQLSVVLRQRLEQRLDADGCEISGSASPAPTSPHVAPVG